MRALNTIFHLHMYILWFVISSPQDYYLPTILFIVIPQLSPLFLIVSLFYSTHPGEFNGIPC